MSQTSNYSVEDVETFLQITREASAQPERKIMQNLLDVQDKISIFRGIDPEELKAIVYNLQFVKFKFKDYVVEEGEVNPEIFYIISGECHVFHNNKKVGKLGKGEVFGESGAIFKTKRNASVVCASKEAMLLSFCIDENNMDFCAPALATIYKNLASEINAKLQEINASYIKK